LSPNTEDETRFNPVSKTAIALADAFGDKIASITGIKEIPVEISADLASLKDYLSLELMSENDENERSAELSKYLNENGSDCGYGCLKCKGILVHLVTQPWFKGWVTEPVFDDLARVSQHSPSYTASLVRKDGYDGVSVNLESYIEDYDLSKCGPVEGRLADHFIAGVLALYYSIADYMAIDQIRPCFGLPSITCSEHDSGVQVLTLVIPSRYGHVSLSLSRLDNSFSTIRVLSRLQPPDHLLFHVSDLDSVRKFDEQLSYSGNSNASHVNKFMEIMATTLEKVAQFDQLCNVMEKVSTYLTDQCDLPTCNPIPNRALEQGVCAKRTRVWAKVMMSKNRLHFTVDEMMSDQGIGRLAVAYINTKNRVTTWLEAINEENVECVTADIMRAGLDQYEHEDFQAMCVTFLSVLDEERLLEYVDDRRVQKLGGFEEE